MLQLILSLDSCFVKILLCNFALGFPCHDTILYVLLNLEFFFPGYALCFYSCFSINFDHPDLYMEWFKRFNNKWGLGQSLRQQS